MAILDSTEISASEESSALEKAPVQFMPLRKLSREGRSSDYADLEIKREMPFSPSVLHA